MASNTKERIIDAALDIFSRDGYLGANIKDMAEACGLVKSAFYRHFKDKEEVWNALIEQMEKYYGSKMGSNENKIPSNAKELSMMVHSMVDFTIHDEKVIKVRKLLYMEQFRNERINKLASKYFFYYNLDVFDKVFQNMMDNGTLEKCDSNMLSLEFTAPITSLIHLCDREPDKEKQVLLKIESFVNHFIKIHNIK